MRVNLYAPLGAFAMVASLLALWLAPAAADAAAPGWKLLGYTSPTNLPPRQSEVQRLTVEASGGSFTLSRVTGGAKGSLSFGRGFASYGAGVSEITVFFMSEGAFAVGQEIIAGPGIAPGTTITAVNGGVLEISEPTQGAGTFATVDAASKKVAVTDISGGLHVGDTISGPGIPVGTTVTSIDADVLTLSAFPSQSGSVNLTASQTTEPIDFDADSQELLAALEGLPAHPAGSLTVTGGPGGDQDHPYFIQFGGPLAGRDVTEITATGSFPSPGDRATVVTTIPGGPGQGDLEIVLTNVGGAASTGAEELTVGPLPTGLTVSGPPTSADGSWSCPGVGAGDVEFTCLRTGPLDSLRDAHTLKIPVTVDAGAEASSTVPIKIEGGGATRIEQAAIEVTVSSDRAEPGVQVQWAGAFDDEGNPSEQAGGHPYSAASSFALNRNRHLNGEVRLAGDAHNVIADLPPGFMGNPTVTPRCPGKAPFYTGVDCKDDSIVGEVTVNDPQVGTARALVTSSVPRLGFPAQFNFVYLNAARLSIVGFLRSDEDYGVSIFAPRVAQDLTPVSRVATVLQGRPAGANGKAFLTNPMDCKGHAERPPLFWLHTDFWHQMGQYRDYDTPVPAVTGCDKLEFTPSFTFQPSSDRASTGVATTAHVHVDQDRMLDPDQLAPPHLKDSVVTLPEGLTLNPSAADGLEACSTKQIGFKGGNFPMPNPMRFDKESVKCPDASKIGTAEIRTPVLEDPLMGTVYLAAQGDNPFGSLLAMYIVVDDEQTGIVVKLPGEVIPDQKTGQLKAVFENNPQTPFEDLILKFRGGGPRSTLATPAVCGSYSTKGSWTPWSAPDSGPAAQTEHSFAIDNGPGGAACANSEGERPFEPSFAAGTKEAAAGGESGHFVMRIGRKDGEQELKAIKSVKLPEGLVGRVGSVPLCEAVQADAGTCPESSRVGRVLVSAGVGPNPIWVPGAGKDPTGVYLSGPYRGAPYSLSIVVPAQAGPFDLGKVVVRSALHVDERTAQISSGVDETRLIKSDGTVKEVLPEALPRILEGIVLNQREIRLVIDRDGFMINPTDCSEQQITAELYGYGNGQADVGNRFQAGGCRSLGFKPKFRARILDRGRRSTLRSWHPRTRFTLVPRPGDANIGGARVALPSSTILDQGNIGTTCTRAQMAADNCPARSVVGYAKAWSPLLKDVVQGPVFLAANGGVRPLSDLAAVLDGEVRVVLQGEVSTLRTGGKARLQNTFRVVPDAPVTRFELTMRGGKNRGLLVNSTDLCRSRERGVAVFTGQNNARSRSALRLVPTFKGCKKVRRKAARRAAKRKLARKAAIRRLAARNHMR